jgi:uncharacterized membrane protein YgaE (UPF0421/DUF939 family)
MVIVALRRYLSCRRGLHRSQPTRYKLGKNFEKFLGNENRSLEIFMNQVEMNDESLWERYEFFSNPKLYPTKLHKLKRVKKIKS